jgi:hypothetical protein
MTMTKMKTDDALIRAYLRTKPITDSSGPKVVSTKELLEDVSRLAEEAYKTDGGFAPFWFAVDKSGFKHFIQPSPPPNTVEEAMAAQAMVRVEFERLGTVFYVYCVCSRRSFSADEVRRVHPDDPSFKDASPVVSFWYEHPNRFTVAIRCVTQKENGEYELGPMMIEQECSQFISMLPRHDPEASQ